MLLLLLALPLLPENRFTFSFYRFVRGMIQIKIGPKTIIENIKMDTLATLQIPIKPDFPYGQDTL